MPIVFDEVSAEIAPPAASGSADTAAQATLPAAETPDAVEQVRHALALLRERELRSVAD